MGKPSYIGTLNAIANGERRGHELFKEWSAATQDKQLKKTLDMVAIREMEHSWAFEKRLCELGFSLRTPADDVARKAFAKQLKLLKSGASDAEKYASFGITNRSVDGSNKGKKKGKKQDKKQGKKTKEDKRGLPRPDRLLSILADTSVDPKTGELMGRFICEERDTGRQLRKAYKAMRRRKGRKAA